MKQLKIWVCLLAIVLSAGSWSDDRYVAEAYKLIIPPLPVATDDKIEVLEFFWYGCPHCYDLEPHLETWLASKPDDVEFVRVPGVLGKGWLIHAKAYYTAEILNVVDKIHRPLFDALHKEGQHIGDEKSLKSFFVSHGVDGGEFTKVFNSEEVDNKVKMAFILGKDYKITGVPTIIVNGKYRTSASMSGGNPGIIDTINNLADKERTLKSAQNKP